MGLDATVLSVALPTLARALHASESDLQWFSSGYLLVLAVAMLPAGLLGDRYGRKRVMLIALALFGAGSAACAMAPTAGAFIAARALLGVAGAGVIVMALSALTVLFSEEERPRAVGIWAAANFLAMPIGPILGGWLLTHYWWGWVFLINVPVAAVGYIATSALVPESRAPTRPKLDPVGTLASMAGLGVLTYGLIRAGQDGWGDALALALMAVGAVVLVGFFAWERRLGRRRGGQPLVDLTLFESRSFTWGVVLAGIAIVPMVGVLFTMPQYFQGVLGLNAMASGVRLLPLVGGLILGALPADRVTRLLGAKAVVAFGFRRARRGAVARQRHQGWIERRLRRRVDGGRGARTGPLLRDGGVGRRLRTARGAKRRRSGGHAGPAKGRRSVRRGDPRQRAERRLSRAARPLRPAVRGRPGGSPKRVRRHRRCRQGWLGRAASLSERPSSTAWIWRCSSRPASRSRARSWPYSSYRRRMHRRSH